MNNYFSEKIVVDEPQVGLSTFVMPTGAKAVITFAGSLLCGSLYSPKKNSEISSLVAGMLDKGTNNKDKFEVNLMTINNQINQIENLTKGKIVNEKQVLTLMRYYELIKEIKNGCR